MANSIITGICNSCSCSIPKAQEYLDNEMRYLRELKVLGDLRFSDFEMVCEGLGLEHDYVEYFVQSLAS